MITDIPLQYVSPERRARNIGNFKCVLYQDKAFRDYIGYMAPKSPIYPNAILLKFELSLVFAVKGKKRLVILLLEFSL